MIPGEYILLIPVGIILFAIFQSKEAANNKGKSALKILCAIAIFGSLTGYIHIKTKDEIHAVTSLLKEANKDTEFHFEGSNGHTRSYISGKNKGKKAGSFQYLVTSPSGENSHWIVKWHQLGNTYKIDSIKKQ